MVLLEDALTKESVHNLHEAFLEGVLEVERTKAGDFLLSKSNYQRVGPPIIRYMHSKLWESSRPNDTGKFIDFPRVTNASLNAFFRDEGISHKTGRSVAISSDVGRIIQHSGLGLFRRPLWYLKPYNESRLEWISIGDWNTKVDPKVEKRIEEEADKPVVSRIDLRQIQRPKEFTAEAVGEFIERFVPAALKLQDQVEELVAQNASLVAHHKEHHERDEAGGWRGVASKIEDALGG